jgi:TatD DNase family protein
MKIPGPDYFIDIHNHDVITKPGIFEIDNIMVHEEREPDNNSDNVYSAGIHPWFLTEANFDLLLERVDRYSELQSVVAIGETGFDKPKGPSIKLQRKAFEAQVRIADKKAKPLFIHNVKAWDELLSEHKRMKPKTVWIVHGFQGKRELADQLLSKGMYLSLWADFVLNRDSAQVIKNIPVERLFLETDGIDVDIREIYRKVSEALQISVFALREIICKNYLFVFGNSEDKKA